METWPCGKLPKGKVLHHVKPVVEGGKTTLKIPELFQKQSMNRLMLIEKEEVEFKLSKRNKQH